MEISLLKFDSDDYVYNQKQLVERGVHQRNNQSMSSDVMMYKLFMFYKDWDIVIDPI